jgi:hypothetical protein
MDISLGLRSPFVQKLLGQRDHAGGVSLDPFAMEGWLTEPALTQPGRSFIIQQTIPQQRAQQLHGEMLLEASVFRDQHIFDVFGVAEQKGAPIRKSHRHHITVFASAPEKEPKHVMPQVGEIAPQPMASRSRSYGCHEGSSVAGSGFANELGRITAYLAAIQDVDHAQLCDRRICKTRKRQMH